MTALAFPPPDDPPGTWDPTPAPHTCEFCQESPAVYLVRAMKQLVIYGPSKECCKECLEVELEEPNAIGNAIAEGLLVRKLTQRELREPLSWR